MTKSERLLLILRILHSQESTSMEQLCEQFGVSDRTIFRDIRALSDIDIPVYYDSGYRLQSNEFDFRNSLSADEQVLLRYCLTNNPIARYTVFQKLLHQIAEKLSDNKLTDPSRTGRKFAAGYSITKNIRNSKSNENLKLFFKALKLNHAVVIDMKKKDAGKRRFQPRSIALTSKGPVLIVRDLLKKNIRQLNMGEIVEISEA